MAPDLNSVSKASNNAQSTHTTSTQQSPNLSRRTSSIMGPPPVPQNSSLPNSPRPNAANLDQTAFAATGPIRHPRPLTAAELHLELEKEQESIVNRLTRELSALRAQTASVASTTSSTSDLFTSNQNDPYLYPYNAPNIIPTSARRHRSSSNLSSRSARSARDNVASTAAGATSVSAVAAPRDRDHTSHSHQTSSRPSIDIPRPEISRQNSTSGGGGGASTSAAYRTTSGSAAASPHWTTSHHTSYPYPHPRHSVSSSISTTANYAPSSAAGGGAGSGSDVVYTRSPSASMTASQAQARYEEAALQRAELEAVKRENEALKTKIRELERNLAEKVTTVNAKVEKEEGTSGGSGGGGGSSSSAAPVAVS